MYPKGREHAAHDRAIIDDDAKWRDILRGLNKTFYHQTVTANRSGLHQPRGGTRSQQGIRAVSHHDQDPVFEFRVQGSTLSYHWATSSPDSTSGPRTGSGFGDPAVRPTEGGRAWRPHRERGELSVDENFYVTASRQP